MCDDGVGDVEEQVELIPLPLQNRQQIGQVLIRCEDARDVHQPVRTFIEDIELITDTLHNAPESREVIRAGGGTFGQIVEAGPPGECLSPTS